MTKEELIQTHQREFNQSRISYMKQLEPIFTALIRIPPGQNWIREALPLFQQWHALNELEQVTELELRKQHEEELNALQP